MKPTLKCTIELKNYEGKWREMPVQGLVAPPVTSGGAVVFHTNEGGSIISLARVGVVNWWWESECEACPEYTEAGPEDVDGDEDGDEEEAIEVVPAPMEVPVPENTTKVLRKPPRVYTRRKSGAAVLQ